MSPRVRTSRRAARSERVRLIHWDPAKAPARQDLLESAGFLVDATPFSPASSQAMRMDPPDAIVIDLDRAPSRGRDLGIRLRQRTATRRTPLVFMGGTIETLGRVRELLPDAAFASWSRAPDAIRRAIRNPPDDPVRPGSVFAAYTGKPLAGRLGIRAGMRVELSGAPRGFERTLGELPEGVVLRRRAAPASDLLLWFPRDPRDLERRIGAFAKRVPRGGLWIVWAKQGSKPATGLSQPLVRRTGLASGLVDYRVVRIDETWAGLRFTRRAP